MTGGGRRRESWLTCAVGHPHVGVRIWAVELQKPEEMTDVGGVFMRRIADPVAALA
jgi:hypothetical protein